MDKFTESLTEGLRRFAMAGVGAISLTIEKSKEIIDQLAERGEVSAAESRTACEDLQKKMSAQLEAFTKKLKADYENASFEQMLARCDSLTPEQKARLMERLSAPAEEVPAEDVSAEDVPAEDVPAEDVPSEDVPAEDVPAEDTPAEEPQTQSAEVSAPETGAGSNAPDGENPTA